MSGQTRAFWRRPLRRRPLAEALDLSTWTARELGAAVTPLFTLPGRVQQQALNELVIRCEVADRLASDDPKTLTKYHGGLAGSGRENNQ